MEIASAGRSLPSKPRVLPALVALVALLEAAGGCRRGLPKTTVPGPGLPAAGVAIEGRIVDRHGHPVPEARVIAFPLSGSSGPGETTTDLEGHFRVEPLSTGTYRVLIEAPGFPAAETASVTAPTAELLVRVDGEGRTVGGRVAMDGAPVVGARVLLAAELGGPVRETLTRAGGAFAFGGLGEGRFALRADLVAATAASATARQIEIGEAGVSASVRLELRPAQIVSGRVIDDAAAGWPETEVRLESAGEAPGLDPIPIVARSDGAGRFSAGPVPPGAYRLSAARPGAILRRAPIVRAAARPAAGPPPVILELVRGARLSGRVGDGHGSPAVGAQVRCVASAIDDLTVQTGPLPLAAEAAALPSGAGRALGSTRVTVTDRQGRFTVDDLIPGRYRLEIAHPGAEPFHSDELALTPGERRDLGGLALRAGLAVEGRVVDESGTAIEGVRVLVSGVGPTVTPVDVYALTDAAGRFTFALTAGEYRLTTNAPGRGVVQTPVSLAGAGPPAPLEIRLVRAAARLEGLARDTGGRPLARARIVVWPLDETAAPIGSGTTDVGGHFTIAALPAGDLRLEIQHPDYPSHTEPVVAGTYALVTVPFPGAIAGEIRARASGAAVTRARIDAVGPGGAKAATEIRKAGAFRLTRLVPGRWRLTVMAPGFQATEQELDVAPSLILGEPSVRDLRVELDPS